MESISGLQIAIYIFCVFIIGAFAAKVIKYAKMPTHLRWELYPLPGETKRPWGGSYLEESEWWTKPREEKSLLGELKFIAQELMFFKEYYDRNRSFWYLVYPFHIGLFLFVGFFVLLLIGALAMVGGLVVSTESANAWGKLVYYATLVVGGAGLVLGTATSIGLLIKRLVDENLKPYTKRTDYFNLLFVLVIFLTGLLSWALADHSFTALRGYIKGVITFSAVGDIGAMTVTHIILLLLFLAYMPFTSMMHFFAKWFTFHVVRWDDVPNLRGSNLERELGPLFDQPVSWSAPHIQAIKRWRDIGQAVSGPKTARTRIAPAANEPNEAPTRKGVS